MRARRHFWAVTAAVVVAAVVAAASAGADTPRLRETQHRVIYNATKQYRDLDVALADGYVPAGECTEMPGVGGMGYHYLNPELVRDNVIDPARPEVLVYQRDRQGRLRLGAVEYLVPDDDQDLATAADRPSLFGQFAFDGPMPGHEEAMPVHYDLHVWLYRHNPAGQLAAWNPKVACP